MSNPDYDLLSESAAAGAEAGARPMLTRPILQDLAAELVRFDRPSGRVQMAFTPAERHLQGHGVVAGGVVGSMLDIAMSLPVLGVLEPQALFATAVFSVNLMAPVRPRRLLAEGWIERRSARVAFCAARLTSEGSDRRLLATGTSTVLLLGLNPNT